MTDQTDTGGDTEHDHVPLYASPNFAEVDMILDVLEDHNIDVFVRERDVPGLPTNVGESGEQQIIVREDQTERARELVVETIEQGPEGDDGRFLDTDDD
ncbi:MAG: putative signal transducing protein [Bradymonadaceae bacterium]